MTDALDYRSKEALTHYLSLSVATGTLAVAENMHPVVIDALFQLTSQIHVSDAALASRWDCSVALLQKMRRLGNGAPYLRLSPGLIRHSLLDIVSYEAAMRFSAVRGGRS
jgi:hypothetical protein